MTTADLAGVLSGWMEGRMSVPKRAAVVVVVESPYAGDVPGNVEYARAAVRDCILRGEAPFASHLLYTQPGVLRDDVPEERELGIEAGFAFRASATRTVVYTDRGVTRGMTAGVAHSKAAGCPVEYRSLTGWASNPKETL